MSKMSEKEEWQIKYDYKMPNGRVFHCTYGKALKKLNSGRYGEGSFKEIKKSPRSLDRSLGITKKKVKSMKGKVKKITDRGFGFIKTEDGKEVFFHSSKCKDLFLTFKKDDAVTFEIAPSERQPGKMQAVKVRHDSDF